jgi:tetratricopeptide (TPR) repeat protein
LLIKKVLSLPDVLNACLELEKAKKYNDAYDLYYMLSYIYKDSKPIKKSLKSISSKATREPDLPKDIESILVDMYQKKQIDVVYELCEELEGIYSKNIFLLNLKASTLRAKNKPKEALSVYQKALKIDPNIPELHNNIGNVYKNLEDIKSAKESFQKALDLRSNYFEALANLADTLKKGDEFTEAIELYYRSIKLNPRFTPALLGLGESLFGLDRYAEALEAFGDVLKIEPESATVFSFCSKVYIEIGKSDEAMECINRALSIDAENTAYLYSKAYIHHHLGEAKECIKTCERILELDSSMSKVHRLLSEIKKYSDPKDKHILEMEALLKDNENIYDRVDYAFALSKAYEDVSDIDRSFSYLKEGNTILREHQTYRVKNDRERFEKIKEIFRGEIISSGGKDDEKRAIFILGMPRSGTSLVEQILSAHTQVHGCGELSFLNSEVKSFLKSNHSLKDASKISQGYLGRLKELGFSEKVFTDKMPHNFRYIGFILSAFPNAKIINLQREPMAVSWSIYKTYFPAGGLGYASSFEEIAEFYRFYLDAMEFWRSLYGGSIYDLDYELLTLEPKAEIERLLKHCELEWEDGCLDFHKQKRVVTTASAQQVREKIYSGSSKKWERFKEHLEPLKLALSEKGVI